MNKIEKQRALSCLISASHDGNCSLSNASAYIREAIDVLRKTEPANLKAIGTLKCALQSLEYVRKRIDGINMVEELLKREITT